MFNNIFVSLDFIKRMVPPPLVVATSLHLVSIEIIFHLQATLIITYELWMKFIKLINKCVWPISELTCIENCQRVWESKICDD